ncbi:superoxide dismutase [Candidatus Pacearchaeota archaeon]|nr:superoxide dismutase [Candidatus Pacearchaeota archaeon]
MPFTLPKLAYEYTALEPFIDSQTMQIHHTKHHQTYVDKLNEAIAKHPELANNKVEELLADNLKIIPDDIKTAVRNHGGGHLNHSFFWELLAKDKPISDNLKKIIEKQFESFDKFKEEFSNAALTRFGSGWVWLVLTKDKKLKIYSTANQDSPLMQGDKPLLGLDVWEHSYYIKWTSNRKGYVENWWNVVNWEQVEKSYNSK